MKTKSKILSAVVALLVAIIAAASSTYAWFTMNSKVTLNDFTVGVTSGNDTLLIAVTEVGGTPNAGDYKMTASLESIAKAIVKSANPEASESEIDNITNDNASEKIKAAVKFDALTTISTKIELKNQNNTEADKASYISFDVHFQATKEMKVYLNDASTVTGTAKTQAGVTAWEKIGAGVYAQNVTGVRVDNKVNGSISTEFGKDALLSINPANAVRIGFVSGTTTNIWNPNFEQGFNKRSETAVDTYNMNLAEAYNYAVSSKQNAPATNPDYLEDDNIGLYPAVLDKNGTTVINGTTDNGYIADSTVLATLVESGSKSTAKITVTIWLEGNDGDCFNSIFSGNIITSLSFLAQ